MSRPEPSSRSRAEQLRRSLFSPRTVAVIGASPREQSLGFRVIRNLRTFGFRGDIYPINPRQTDVLDLRCLPSIAAVTKPVDLAVLAIPSIASMAWPELTPRAGAPMIVDDGYKL